MSSAKIEMTASVFMVQGSIRIVAKYVSYLCLFGTIPGSIMAVRQIAAMLHHPGIIGRFAGSTLTLLANVAIILAVNQHLFGIKISLLPALVLICMVEVHAEGCPTARDEIATDRPDVTNSSRVVPAGSLQSENGVNFSMRGDSRVIDGTNSRWRLGVAPCLEIRHSHKKGGAP